METIRFYMTRARSVNREILDLSAYIAPEVIGYINDIENRGYFNVFDEIYQLYSRNVFNSPDMSWLARNVFDYLQIVDRLDEYRHKFLETTFTPPSYLVAGTERTSKASPLKR